MKVLLRSLFDQYRTHPLWTYQSGASFNWEKTAGVRYSTFQATSFSKENIVLKCLSITRSKLSSSHNTNLENPSEVLSLHNTIHCSILGGKRSSRNKWKSHDRNIFIRKHLRTNASWNKRKTYLLDVRKNLTHFDLLPRVMSSSRVLDLDNIQWRPYILLFPVVIHLNIFVLQ